MYMTYCICNLEKITWRRVFRASTFFLPAQIITSCDNDLQGHLLDFSHTTLKAERQNLKTKFTTELVLFFYNLPKIEDQILIFVLETYSSLSYVHLKKAKGNMFNKGRWDSFMQSIKLMKCG